MPQCGFSRASIQILGLQGVNPQKFTAFNVLEDEELRQGMLNRVAQKRRGVGDWRRDRWADNAQESKSTQNGRPFLSYM